MILFRLGSWKISCHIRPYLRESCAYYRWERGNRGSPVCTSVAGDDCWYHCLCSQCRTPFKVTSRIVWWTRVPRSIASNYNVNLGVNCYVVHRLQWNTPLAPWNEATLEWTPIALNSLSSLARCPWFIISGGCQCIGNYELVSIRIMEDFLSYTSLTQGVLCFFKLFIIGGKELIGVLLYVLL